MSRVINFSSGPATLSETVLRQAAADMLDWRGSGMSVMEMSHRGPEFTEILAGTGSLIRSLLGVPDNYAVLLLQGGAIAENAIVPMNLIGRTGQADYVLSGVWSKKSMKEASRYGQVKLAASSKDSGFLSMPAQTDWRLSAHASYVHMCSNETIGGVECRWSPDTGSVPLVADMSSNIMSAPLDVSRYGLIYAGAQKNMGPSGVTLVIVRRDLLGHALAATPSAFNYQLQDEQSSMYNTPPTYAIYIMGLVLKHIQEQGGLPAMQVHNQAKADLLYDFLDHSTVFSNRVAREDRSRMNVTFFLKDESLNAAFLQGAEKEGMVQLRGHRSAGGMRASIYNAMSLASVQRLRDYMHRFEKANS
ncbi:MAG: 3-phosphoserine/phosphohydroxythreonine transaminase [Limnohabitans sp.]|nr:3-phosphoserine/phosphohydroxythreonine transaminase [Limnohabitans sp.]